jgi:drug/metabolite transporter (DMT)-like permease
LDHQCRAFIDAFDACTDECLDLAGDLAAALRQAAHLAGAGTLYTYSKIVALLGPARAAVFPALAPGIAAILAWPVPGHVPTGIEAAGLLIAVTGLLITVTAGRTPHRN